MKIGLVMGAGGVVGMAWLTGGLEALAEETGWDPMEADHVVGTSAGSLVATMAAGRRPFAARPVANGSTDGTSDSSARGAPPDGAHAEGDGRRWPPEEITSLRPFRLHRGVPQPGVGSWRLALSTAARPDRHTPLALYSAWLPNGLLSTSAVGELVRAVAPSGWGSHPGMWIVACDYDTGRRVAFGREDAPSAELHDAVAASCAIPGTYRSVRIGSRRYVDGGMYSTSNLDVLRDRDLDLVICLNPTSTLHPTHAWNPLERMAKVWRSESGRRLGREARKLRAGGTEVVLVQPTGEDLTGMGTNLMSLDRERHRRVTDLARRTVAEQLRRPENAERLEGLSPRRAGELAVQI